MSHTPTHDSFHTEGAEAKARLGLGIDEVSRRPDGNKVAGLKDVLTKEFDRSQATAGARVAGQQAPVQPILIRSPQNTPGATFVDEQKLSAVELEDLRRRAAAGDTSAIEQMTSLTVFADGTGSVNVRQVAPQTTQQAIQGAAIGALQGGPRGVPQVQGAQVAPTTVDQSGTDFTQLLGLGARGQQQQGFNLSLDAAQGLSPSVAAIQQQQGLDAALNQQFALASSAQGGPAAQAAAQRQAAVQAAGISQQGVNAASLLRAGEIAQARGEVTDAAGQIRTGDATQADIASGLALGQADITSAEAIQDANLNQEANLANVSNILKSRGLDDIRINQLLSQLNATDLMTLNAQLSAEGLRIDDFRARTGQFSADTAATASNRDFGLDLSARVAGAVPVVGPALGQVVDLFKSDSPIGAAIDK